MWLLKGECFLVKKNKYGGLLVPTNKDSKKENVAIVTWLAQKSVTASLLVMKINSASMIFPSCHYDKNTKQTGAKKPMVH